MAESILSRLNKSNQLFVSAFIADRRTQLVMFISSFTVLERYTEAIGTQIKKKKLLTRIKDEGNVDFII